MTCTYVGLGDRQFPTKDIVKDVTEHPGHSIAIPEKIYPRAKPSLKFQKDHTDLQVT